MAVSYKNRFLAVMRSNEARMTEIFNRLANQVAAAITRRADDAGNIPRSAAYDLQRQVGDLVTGFFIGWGGNGQRMPFDTTPNGIVIPLSPYTVALWVGIKEATRLPVEQNAGLMRARLPADLFTQLQAARVDPFAVARGLAVAEQAFKPNPMATYEAPHTWIDPRGYRLSDRIWDTAGATRRKLDLFMESQIGAGRGAATIAKDLEVFLQPGQQLLRANAPYGTDASYDAMRLARTEIARAHAGAAEQSALLNPFVTELAVQLSGSHPKKDICDAAVADGPWPKDDIPHKFRVPLHPHCLCTYRYMMAPADQQQKLIDEMRTVVVDARNKFADLVGPAAVEEFTNLLLRGGLNIERLTPGVGVPPIRPPVSIPTPAALVRTITRPAPAEPIAPPAEPPKTPVSAGLTAPKRGATRELVDKVGAAIDRVHTDGNLENVPVKVGKLRANWHGVYRSRGSTPVDIKINATSGHQHTTLAHEIGHWLDGNVLGVTRVTNQARRSGDALPARLEAFFDAIRQSPSFDTLQQMRAGKVEVSVVINGKPRVYKADQKYVKYLLQADELWARAYTQYITVRSADPVMLAELASTRAELAYPTQWGDQEFEPIGRAIDEILKFAGWL